MEINWDLIPLFIGFGVIQGSIIALGAIGLSLLFKTVNFINFAYGDSLALGAFIVWQLNQVLGGWGVAEVPNIIISVIVGLALVGLIGVLFHKYLFRPLGSANPLVMLITSVGLAFILRNALLFIWGPEPKKFLLPSQQGLHLGPFIITPIQLLIVGLALVIMVAIYLMLTYTSLGQAIRGTADNPNLARIRGINTENVTSWVWFYSYVLSGLAGVMVGVVTVLNPSMGIHLLLVLFASVIMGGIGNPYGAVVAAMIIGITMEVAPAVPVLAPYKVVVAYLLMILVILFRPKGLFAK